MANAQFDDYEDCVSEMKRCIALYNQGSICEGLLKMVDLYSRLYSTTYHDLADSIEIWLAADNSLELIHSIESKNDANLTNLIRDLKAGLKSSSNG